MGEKVTFDPVNKIIQVTQAPVDGVVNIDVKIDLYSDGKEDWKTSSELIKHTFPLRATGGDPLPGEKALGSTYFLSPPWRIKPYEASHTLRVHGNFYMEDGSSPFVPTDGTYTVTIESTVSNLVDSQVVQLEEIEYASYQNQVWVDVDAALSGTDYPVGTRKYPVNNVSDAIAIGKEKGFGSLGLLSGVTLSLGDSVRDFTIGGHNGHNEMGTPVIIEDAADSQDCEFDNCRISGVLDGGNKIVGCIIEDLLYVNGYIYNSILTGTIQLGGNKVATLTGCQCGLNEERESIVIDMNGAGQDLLVRDYYGNITISNLTGNNIVHISLGSGKVTLDPSITAGTIILQGVGALVDNATSYDVLDTSALMNTASVSEGIFSKTDEAGIPFSDSLLIMRRMLENKVSKAGDIITIYEEDGSTVWRQFDLSDEGREQI